MNLGDFGEKWLVSERRAGLMNKNARSKPYSRSQLMQMQHLSGTFLLGPDRKDPNGSQFQSTKI